MFLGLSLLCGACALHNCLLESLVASLREINNARNANICVVIETPSCQWLESGTISKTLTNSKCFVLYTAQARSMMPEWGLGSVVLAIAALLVPVSVATIRRAIRKWRARLRRCKRLKWEDMPNGRVHECHSYLNSYPSCNHFGRHVQSAKCWESTTSIATIFNRGWQVMAQNHLHAKEVPENLPNSSSFICSDAQTVLAFILCTAGKTGHSLWQPKSLTFDKTRFIVETIGADTVAHIEGSFRSERQLLTKHELGRMLVGWPPWYRQHFQTRSGITLPFPIASDSDILRAGWILAVGLMDLGQAFQEPLALYRCPNEPPEPGFRQNGVTFRQAVRRCRDHIRRNICPRFPDNHLISDALAALNHLVDELTDSGMPEGRLGKSWSPRMRHLSYSQCQFAFRVFNDYTALSDRDKIMLEPILFETLAAAVHGAYEVVRYLKDRGMELKIPPELQPFHREVWLRDCNTRLPMK